MVVGRNSGGSAVLGHPLAVRGRAVGRGSFLLHRGRAHRRHDPAQGGEQGDEREGAAAERSEEQWHRERNLIKPSEGVRNTV